MKIFKLFLILLLIFGIGASALGTNEPDHKERDTYYARGRDYYGQTFRSHDNQYTLALYDFFEGIKQFFVTNPLGFIFTILAIFIIAAAWVLQIKNWLMRIIDRIKIAPRRQQ